MVRILNTYNIDTKIIKENTIGNTTEFIQVTVEE